MKNSKIISKLLVFTEESRSRILVGELYRAKTGFAFRYDKDYMGRVRATPLGPDLPLSLEEIRSPIFFESLKDLIPIKDNPTYDAYCLASGVSPNETDLMILLYHLGKGTSAFIFEVPPQDELPKGEEVIRFRNQLGLSQRQFALLFDIPFATLQAVEKETTPARTFRRLLQVYKESPSLVSRLIEKRGHHLHSHELEKIKNYIQSIDEQIGKTRLQRINAYRERGYFEVSHSLIDYQHTWDQKELYHAAEQAKCPNTGWPIGVVLHTEAGKPRFRMDGIEAEMESRFFGNEYDAWILKQNGQYYFFRSLEEDSDENRHSSKPVLFFDVRIWRIAEALLHCANLYRHLHVPEKSRIDFSITHGGLDNRKLTVSNPSRKPMTADRICHKTRPQTSSLSFRLNEVNGQLKHFAYDVAKELFILFDGFVPDRNVVAGIVDEFLHSKV